MTALSNIKTHINECDERDDDESVDVSVGAPSSDPSASRIATSCPSHHCVMRSRGEVGVGVLVIDVLIS